MEGRRTVTLRGIDIDALFQQGAHRVRFAVLDGLYQPQIPRGGQIDKRSQKSYQTGSQRCEVDTHQSQTDETNEL
jgi:hypothetical protein